MRRIKKIAIFFIALVGIALAVGCIGQKSPSEYFPVSAGMEWSYKINFGSADPRIYTTVVYNPIVRGFVSDELAEWPYEEIIISDTYKKESKCCHLKFKIGRIGSRQVNDQNMLIAELKIVQDDVGLYRSKNPLNHSWVMTEGPEGFKAIKMAIIPAREFGLITPNMLVNSVQLVFFDPSGNENERSVVEGDSLRLIGRDNNAPECEGSPCMHFQRIVPSIKMTEDTWFASGKGLVRLEQKINGEPSMTWILEDFKTS